MKDRHIEISALYHPELLEYAHAHPRMRSEQDTSLVIRAYNPLCGDKYEVRIEAAERITDTSFFGYGCVVSKASTAMLTDLLIGKTPKEVAALIKAFLNRFQEGPATAEIPQQLLLLTAARNYPGRRRCATLAWEAVLKEFCREEFP